MESVHCTPRQPEQQLQPGCCAALVLVTRLQSMECCIIVAALLELNAVQLPAWKLVCGGVARRG
jgi:hypothetical protein